jgi:hypothetical protein
MCLETLFSAWRIMLEEVGGFDRGLECPCLLFLTSEAFCGSRNKDHAFTQRERANGTRSNCIRGVHTDVTNPPHVTMKLINNTHIKTRCLFTSNLSLR